MPGPIAAYRRYWLPELAALAALAAATTLLFAVTDLDVASARLFYRPGSPDPWPLAALPPWNALYRSAPWVTGSLALAGAAALVTGRRSDTGRLRLYGLFILLCVAVGPGLIVNGILKDHWGRPRPRQIVAFGGPLEYAPPILPSGARGKSFPCGHCSVGYLYGAGWWVWRRSRPRLAAASLAAGAAAGTLLGFGRMAAGAHFLSDAAWSGLIALGVAHALYHYVLRVPAREDGRLSVYPWITRSAAHRRAALAGALLLGLGIVAGGLLASPSDKDLSATFRLADYPSAPERFEVVADTLDVEITLVAQPQGRIDCRGSVHGFGPPTSAIEAFWTFDPRPAPTVRFRVARKGLFTDIDGAAHIRVPIDAFETIVVRVGRGDITVADASGGAFSERRPPVLDLRTRNGRVVTPSEAGY